MTAHEIATGLLLALYVAVAAPLLWSALSATHAHRKRMRAILAAQEQNDER